ncbi:hypothetical protein [Calycomorphotria hydatis]|uniref:Uncharacterized protein n=1 Tax=Calycomorphotria hydatis TaxID=2528027 RepID=A0A517T3W2_9PLAN|nr:hypothetical protein [Calycomorphotria hydatis]QDT63064.1 hypothetical protein V22_02630 [Calycomorphotria hydatis]
MNRREFTVGSAALLGGVWLSHPSGAGADDAGLTDKHLVELGINALARSPERNYFNDGHRGAAMISAHMMCVDNHFDDAATSRINELFNRNWASTKLCAPFPAGDRVEDATEQVGKALAEGSGVLRQVGHDAIFAMHAIKAFRLLPETATKERVDGVCRLIKAFTPWRDVPPDESIDPPPFSDEKAAARFVLREASDAIDRFAGFGQGFAGHMLTFGQSIIEMAAMGDVEWAESCRTAFCKYVTVTREGPKPDDRKRGVHRMTSLRPDQAKYWQQRGEKTLGIGHVFKYPYAYYDLVARAQDPELEAEFDAKAWRLF